MILIVLIVRNFGTATDNAEKETTGDVHVATKCTAKHSGTNSWGIEPIICQLMQNLRRGSWV